MKAWMDDKGFIHVSATTNIEKFAIRWHRDNMKQTPVPIIVHEEEPVQDEDNKCDPQEDFIPVPQTSFRKTYQD